MLKIAALVDSSEVGELRAIVEEAERSLVAGGGAARLFSEMKVALGLQTAASVSAKCRRKQIFFDPDLHRKMKARANRCHRPMHKRHFRSSFPVNVMLQRWRFQA